MTATTEAMRAQARFRALLNALARPGTRTRLEPAPAPFPSAGGPLAIAETLLDHEVRFSVVGSGLDESAASLFRREVRLRTGAALASVQDADFVFVFGSPGSVLRELKTGVLLFPDQGATLIWSIDNREGSASVTLAGPGVVDEGRVRIAGVAPADLHLLSEINIAYPYGLDAFFVDEEGVVVGLPRTTRVIIEPDVS